jgi:hypothetical protein
MHAVTTIGLDIAKSVFQARHRPRRQGAHPPSAEAPLCFSRAHTSLDPMLPMR